MSRSRPSSSFRPECIINTTQTFPGCLSTYISTDIDFDEPLYPLSALISVNDDLVYSPRKTRTMLSPPCFAALQGLDEVIRFLDLFQKVDEQRDLDFALFLANRSGHLETADLLLSYGAKPGQESFSNGLHGAAWRGLKSQIYHYINNLKAKPNVTDGSSATPVIYALLSKQDEQDAWDTIECLFGLGAEPKATFGSEDWTYAEIARKMRKGDLAKRLEDFAKPGSPTISNSSRESSCTVGRDNDFQPGNKRPRGNSEVGGGAKRARGA